MLEFSFLTGIFFSRRVLLDCSGIKINAPEKFYTDLRRVANSLSSARNETCELSDRQYTHRFIASLLNGHVLRFVQKRKNIQNILG